MGYGDISLVLGAFFAHVIWENRGFTAVLQHTELFPLPRRHCSARCLITRALISSVCANSFLKRHLGQSKVFSPFSITELVQGHSLPPGPAAQPHPKTPMWSAVASALIIAANKEWLEEQCHAKVLRSGSDLTAAVQRLLLYVPTAALALETS